MIAPSMLKCDFGNLQREIALLEAAGASILHWDVMDGHFVPNLSYGAMVIERVRSATSLVFDAHLMMSQPGAYLDDFVKAGCDCITIHAEIDDDPLSILKDIHARGIAAGIAISPETPVSAIEPMLSECDLVLVMSVKPGFGGQKFMPEMTEKVQDLRDRVGSETLISIDGGIGPTTISQAAKAGADVFVAGSSVFDSPDYRLAIEEMENLARSSRDSNTHLLER
ncbi:MAG: ribulose-phosphate 3-epimerase [Planctomycetaceae bacterium]